MHHKAIMLPMPRDGDQVDRTPAVQCRIRDGIAVVTCAPEGSFIAYRHALGASAAACLSARYAHAGRGHVVRWRRARSGTDARVTGLTRFIEPPEVLRVAVLTTAAGCPRAIRAVEHVDRLGIVATVFTNTDRDARAWLISEHPAVRSEQAFNNTPHVQ